MFEVLLAGLEFLIGIGLLIILAKLMWRLFPNIGAMIITALVFVAIIAGLNDCFREMRQGASETPRDKQATDDPSAVRATYSLDSTVEPWTGNN